MPMPYSLSKGPILSVLETLLNPRSDAEHERLYEGLAKLRDPDVLLTSISLVDSSNVQSDGVNADPLAERLNEYWFGFVKRGGDDDEGRSKDDAAEVPELWGPQRAFSPTDNATTGYWVDYFGNVEGILRETLIRTIEVSLGIPAGGDPRDATRHWEVELFWKCGNPWVEGWVTWRRHHGGGDIGQVTTILATPIDKMNHLRIVPAQPPHGAAALIEPDQAEVNHGMWLVSQERHTRVTDDEERRHSASEILREDESWHDQGEVTVLELTTEVGGAAPHRLPYEPSDGYERT
jgi:hypothetical protein